MCQVIEYSNICIDTQLKTTIVVFSLAHIRLRSVLKNERNFLSLVRSFDRFLFFIGLTVIITQETRKNPPLFSRFPIDKESS